MIQKLKLLILTMSSMFIMAAPLAVAGTAHATFDQNDINKELCSGSKGVIDTSGGSNCNNSDAPGRVSNLITKVVNILSAVVGIIAVIMIIVAGLRYVTSGGKEEGVKNAKNTILYAVIGLVVVALAQLIVHFVLNQTTNATT